MLKVKKKLFIYKNKYNYIEKNYYIKSFEIWNSYEIPTYMKFLYNILYAKELLELLFLLIFNSKFQ